MADYEFGQMTKRELAHALAAVADYVSQFALDVDEEDDEGLDSRKRARSRVANGVLQRIAAASNASREATR